MEEIIDSMKHMTILIADDNLTDRMLLLTYLKKMGFVNIVQAENGFMAENKIWNAIDIQQKFDLLFIDWKMPRREGTKIIQDFRQHRDFKNAGFFMLTGVSDEKNVKHALTLGVDDYIIKPIRYEVLSQKVEAFLKKRKAS